MPLDLCRDDRGNSCVFSWPGSVSATSVTVHFIQASSRRPSYALGEDITAPRFCMLSRSPCVKRVSNTVHDHTNGVFALIAETVP